MATRPRRSTFEPGESEGFCTTARSPGASGGSTRRAAIDRLLLYASRAIVPLAALTPIDARVERERLTRALRADQPLRPQWRYSPPPPDDGLRRALDAAEALLVHDAEGPLDALYAERIRELALEAALCAAAGTRELGALATARFAPRQESSSERSRAGHSAAAVCARWLSTRNERAQAGSDSRGHSVQSDRGHSVQSDGLEPGSLLQRMRAEVGRLGLPFAVKSAPALAALAATGEEVILVATGRMLSAEVAERTVLHEVHGHAWPRARARHASSVLFRAGTARGADDQEGRALWLEHRAGWLGPARKRQLAARHDAACVMESGASFAEVARRLVREHGALPEEAVVIAERVFRGSDGSFPGLGRERVYLPAWLRVRAHLLERPEDDAILAAGQIAVDSIDVVRRYAPSLEDHSAIRARHCGDTRKRP